MMGQRRQGGNRNLALACASARLPCAQEENSISLRDQLRCMAKEPADQPLTSVWCRVAGRPAGRFWRRKRTLAGEFREASPRGWTRGAGCVGSRPRRPFPILAEIIRVNLDAKMAPPPPMCRPSGTIGLQPLTRGGPSRRAPSRSEILLLRSVVPRRSTSASLPPMPRCPRCRQKRSPARSPRTRRGSGWGSEGRARMGSRTVENSRILGSDSPGAVLR